MRGRALLRGCMTAALCGGLLAGAAHADQVVADDQIVQGGLCVGFDCVNGEAFASDMIRLEENNLRIKFEDSSDPLSSPGNDWQITANDSASGGQSRFSFDDVDAATVPFWLAAGAPTDSLYVAGSGRVGMGTAAPEEALHVAGNLRIDGDLIVTGGLRAGRVAAAALAADGTGSVSFAVPYDRDYAVALTPVVTSSEGKSSVVLLTSDANGFTFAVDGKPGNYVEILWTTRWVGEF